MTGSVTISVTESDAITALGRFLVSIVPAGWEVIEGQVNRVPSPRGSYVVMTPLMRTRLATNHTRVGTSETQILAPTRLTVQVDMRGEGASDVAQTLATLFRDTYAVEAFAAVRKGVVPLYSTDPRQMPMITAESEYQERWGVDCEMQINTVLTIPRQTAGKVVAGVYEVDVTFPPKEPDR